MGLTDKALDALRKVFGQEREERAQAESPSADALKYAPSSTYAIWGREDIGGLLSVSQNLMDRFADYEAMNDYPDIRCFSGEMLVYVVDDGGLIIPTPIAKLAAENSAKKILGYDIEKKKITRVDAQHPRLTGNNAAVVRIKLSNNEVLRVTPEHKILTVEKGYIEAKYLTQGDFLVGAPPGFDTRNKSIVTAPRPGGVWVTESPKPDGVERVYDITTSTKNLIVNGVVCHNSAFHYFANDATQPNLDNGRVIWINSTDAAIQDSANSLIKHRIRLEDDIFSIAYTLAQMGNSFEEILVNNNGVVGLNHLPAPTMRRIEKLDGGLIGYVQDVTGRFTANQDELRRMISGNLEIPKHVALFEDWQVQHFRIRATARRSPYGASVAEGARWIWKRLVMLEDAVMIYKLTRAPSRFAFYIDVTDVPANRVQGYLQRAMRDLKKKKMVNPNNNFLDMRYNPLSNDEDFIFGVREGKALSRVEVLSGPDYQSVEDINYFQRKLHGALMVPRAFLGQDSPVQGRALLSGEDSRAARVTLQLQRELKNGIENIIRTDFAARGVADPKALDFEVAMTMPSNIYELAAMEVKNARADFAARMMPYVSLRWLQEAVFKFTDREIELLEQQREKEAQHNLEKMMAQQKAEMDMQSQMLPQQFGQQSGQQSNTSPDALPPEALPPQAPKAESNLNGPAPDKYADRTAWRTYENLRRLEERRHKESIKNHNQLLERLNTLEQSDRQFARSLAESKAFLEEFRTAAMRSINGRVVAIPSGNNHRR